MRAKPLRVNISSASKSMRVFLKLHIKNCLFSPFTTKYIAYASIFYARKLQTLPKSFMREKKLEKRVFVRTSKIWRVFLSQAFQNVGEKKASKTFNFQFEKSEGKKNLCTLIHLLTQLTKTRFFSLQLYCVDSFFFSKLQKKLFKHREHTRVTVFTITCYFCTNGFNGEI